MSERFLSISEAREELPRLPEQFEKQQGTLTVTRDGEPVMIVMPYDTYKLLLETVDSLRETIKILHDEN